MDIEEFVKTSLEQIVKGVAAAQSDTREADIEGTTANLVNPTLMRDPKNETDLVLSKDRNLVQFVEFDIAVTADATTETRGNGGIRVIGFSLGGEVEALNRDATISRVKFSVPIMFPRAR